MNTAVHTPDYTALRESHVIVPRHGVCEHDGFPVHPIRGGWRHDPEPIREARRAQEGWPR